jgi:hypothetical protein
MVQNGPSRPRRLKKSADRPKQQQPGCHRDQHLPELREPREFCNAEDLAHRVHREARMHTMEEMDEMDIWKDSLFRYVELCRYV